MLVGDKYDKKIFLCLVLEGHPSLKAGIKICISDVNEILVFLYYFILEIKEIYNATITIVNEQCGNF